jgi:hypothetical protein
MPKLSRAQWNKTKGRRNQYLRKGTGTYRDNNKGFVYNRAGKKIGYEPIKAHPYGDDHMSANKAGKAIKLFR